VRFRPIGGSNYSRHTSTPETVPAERHLIAPDGSTGRRESGFTSGGESPLLTSLKACLGEFILVTPDGSVSYASPLADELLGNGTGKWRNAFELVHPDDEPEFRADFQRLVADAEGSLFAIHRFADRDSGWRHIEVRGTNLLEEAGIGAVLLAFRDVTDEFAAREAQAQLAAIVTSTGDAVTSCRSDGTVLTWNPAAERLFGYTAKEIAGRSVYSLAPPEYEMEARAAVSRVCRGELVSTYETDRLTKTGRSVRVAVTPSPIRGANDRVVGFAAIYRDVTRQTEAEAALSKLRAEAERGLAQLRAVVSAMAEGLIIADGNGNLLDWNPAALRMHGFHSLDEVRKHLFEFTKIFALFRLDGVPVPLEEWPLTRLLRGDTLADVDFRVHRLDTKRDCIFSYSGQVVRGSDGRVDLAFLTMRDLTEQKRMETRLRQADKMQAIGSLAGGVAHDFNNLLTVINGYSEMLLSGPWLDASGQELVAEVSRAGEQAAALTRQLLAFSRQQVLAPKVLDLNVQVKDMAKLLHRLIGADVDFATALNPDIGRVRADPGQIEQVLLNLAVNARDAMPRGGRLTIETRNVDLDEAYTRNRPDARPGPHVLLAVTDTGIGMDSMTIARIFEPFFTTKEQGKGTGLGLATVFGIVSQSGGHLDVYSEVGRGTTFKVYLPRLTDAGVPDECLVASSPFPTGAETVLLVEDDRGVRTLARSALESLGYTVLEAHNGEQGVQVALAHSGPIDLVVTDVVMPGSGGRELADRVQAARPEAKVLFTSGYTDDAVVRHGILQSNVAFLQKPFTPTSLARKVREVLDAV
jgi:two-component system, cell cycle sensor histidine kinase and response regulator CckA